MLDGVLDKDAASALEALLITYNGEATNEHACMSIADSWVAKWKRRLQGFLGADDRERPAEPWVPDWDEIRRRDEEAYADIDREVTEERSAAHAQAADDRVLREAMSESGRAPSEPGSPVKGRKRGLDSESASRTVQSFPGGVRVTVELRRPAREFGVQTDN